jgi:hypothetical protein
MREIPHAAHAPSLCNPAPGRVPNLHIVVNQFIWLRIPKKKFACTHDKKLRPAVSLLQLVEVQ